MGSSMVDIKHNGFWTTDGLLQNWLAILASELDQLEDGEEWVYELAAQWREQALSDAFGAIDPRLGAAVTDVTRPTIVKVCRRAINRLDKHIAAGNESISLNDAGIEVAHAHLAISCEAVRVRRVGSAFIAVVQGEMKTPGKIPFVC